MLPTQLLWDPLPDDDRLPPARPRRFHWLRGLPSAVAANAALSRLPAEELVDRRVRRGRVQALVREAYQATVAEQDSAHRRPAELAKVWRGQPGWFRGQGRGGLAGGGR